MRTVQRMRFDGTLETCIVPILSPNQLRYEAMVESYRTHGSMEGFSRRTAMLAELGEACMEDLSKWYTSPDRI